MLMITDPSGLIILISSLIMYLSIYIMLSVSTNIEYGFTGIPNLGKTLFYFMGAIVAARIVILVYDPIIGAVNPFDAKTAVMRTSYAIQNPSLTISIFILTAILAIIVSGVLGYLASYPAISLREDFLAITLLIFGEAMRIFVRTYEPIVGGVFGISGIPGPLIWFEPKPLASLIYSSICMIIAVIVFLLLERFLNSPLGRVLKAVRDDDLVASVFGKDPIKVRALVLTIGSGIAGLAGALYTFYSQAVFPDDFIPPFTFFILAMVLLGGVGNNIGTVLGAVLLSLFERFSQASMLELLGIRIGFDISYFRYMMIGLLIILVLMFRSQGMIPEKPVKTPLYEILLRLFSTGTKRQEKVNENNI